ncbi:MAG: hypothetical protein JWO44_2806 [Bacteroidetes bacterium]|jgi:hypothetical protein|nr:hypothetical protein [Bacteroidota bacterium]
MQSLFSLDRFLHLYPYNVQKINNMKDKINAYHKIRRTIQGSRNELHLQTCTIMIGIFTVRYKDESMRVLLKNEVENKRNEILTLRTKYKNVAY